MFYVFRMARYLKGVVVLDQLIEVFVENSLYLRISHLPPVA